MWHLLFHLIRPLLFPEKDANGEKKEASFISISDPKKFIGYLHKVGYFKYTNASKIAILEESFRVSLMLNKGLMGVDDTHTGIPYDYRIYALNAEELSEKGGFIASLRPLKKTFEKLMIPMIWTNESLIVENNRMTYRISLNGKEYIIYDGSRDFPLRAAITKLKTVQMLNDQLKMSGSDERIYLLSSAKYGRIIFLTKKMQNYIAAILKNENIRPMDTKLWAKWNQLT